MKLLNVIVVLALIAPAARAQQPVSGPATLAVCGVVVTANDTPLPRVRVAPTVALPPELAKLGAFQESARGVLTDDRGQFTIHPTADPDLLDSLSLGAVRITLGEGQSQDLTLRLVHR